MSEERLRILKMVDEGKISVEEANRLLVTIEATDYKHLETKNRVSKKSDTPYPLPLEIIVVENGEKKIIQLK